MHALFHISINSGAIILYTSFFSSFDKSFFEHKWYQTLFITCIKVGSLSFGITCRFFPNKGCISSLEFIFENNLIGFCTYLKVFFQLKYKIVLKQLLVNVLKFVLLLVQQPTAFLNYYQII